MKKSNQHHANGGHSDDSLDRELGSLMDSLSSAYDNRIASPEKFKHDLLERIQKTKADSPEQNANLQAEVMRAANLQGSKLKFLFSSRPVRYASAAALFLVMVSSAWLYMKSPSELQQARGGDDKLEKRSDNISKEPAAAAENGIGRVPATSEVTQVDKSSPLVRMKDGVPEVVSKKPDANARSAAQENSVKTPALLPPPTPPATETLYLQSLKDAKSDKERLKILLRLKELYQKAGDRKKLDSTVEQINAIEKRNPR